MSKFSDMIKKSIRSNKVASAFFFLIATFFIILGIWELNAVTVVGSLGIYWVVLMLHQNNKKLEALLREVLHQEVRAEGA